MEKTLINSQENLKRWYKQKAQKNNFNFLKNFPRFVTLKKLFPLFSIILLEEIKAHQKENSLKKTRKMRMNRKILQKSFFLNTLRRNIFLWWKWGVSLTNFHFFLLFAHALSSKIEKYGKWGKFLFEKGIVSFSRALSWKWWIFFGDSFFLGFLELELWSWNVELI